MVFQSNFALLLALLFFTPAAPQQVSGAKNPDEVYTEALELTKLGRNPAARVRLRKAVNLWKESGHTEQAAAALLEIAALFESQGWFQDALENHREVLGYTSLTGEQKADVSASLARLYLHLHQLDLSLKYYRQAFRIGHRLGNPSIQALSLAGVAAVSAKEGDFKNSATYSSRATKMAYAGESGRKKAETLWLLGRAYEARGLMPEARLALQQALSLYEKASASDEQQALLLSELSNLCLLLGDKEAAVAYAEKARKMAEELNSPEPLWKSWLTLGKTQKALGQTQEALKSFYRAFSFIEMEAIHLSSYSLKVGFMQERLSPYCELTDMLVELGRDGEALKIVEHSRARAVLDTLSFSGLDGVAQGQPQELKEMNHKIARLNAELNSTRNANDRRPHLGPALEEVALLRKEMLIRSESERVKRFTSPANLRQIQEEALREDEMLLEFFLGEDCSYVWLISKDEVRSEALPGRKTIEKQVSQYLALITKRPGNIHIEKEFNRQRAAGSRVFDMLLGNLKESIASAKRLVIIPDGWLFYLPFESLICDNRFLIEEHAITYCPSASILYLLRRTKSNAADAGRLDLLAVGDPDLRGIELQRVGLEGDSGDKGALLPPFELTRLAGAREEVQYIETLFPPGATRVYLGAAVTEATFKREAEKGYRRLHVATHSLVDELYPARSGILFARGRTPEDDGFLGLEEIAGLNLKGCELIVLSSCQTGRGQLFRGEGLIGLGRAFMLAGARSVTVSLWNVSDLSTANVMKRFYRNLADGVTVGESLRQAKLQMIRSRSTRHAFYWAAFVITGDPD